MQIWEMDRLAMLQAEYGWKSSRRCTICGKVKSFDEMTKDRRCLGGRRGRCYVCDRKRQREMYARRSK